MYANSLTICLLLASLVVSAHEVVQQNPPTAVSSDHVEPHQSASVVQAQPGVVEYQAGGSQVVGLNGPSHLYSMVSPDSPLSGQKPGGKPEQYGAPEPAAMPANYKPFGSWGLYVGGNPPDGYYTNFYKSLDSGVVGANQQQGQVQGQSGVQSGAPGVYKQSGPVAFGANQYPYVYSAGELNSAYPVAQGFPSSYSSFDAPQFYATKKVGSPAQQAREMSKTSSSSSSSGTKGHQQQQTKDYAYASPVSHFFQQQQQPQQVQYQSPSAGQVVSYSVPVGSQIVGSQPGTDGAFSPYGVHAFTRYAVKPAFSPSSSQGQYNQNHHYHYAQQQQYQPSPFQHQQQYNGYQNYYPFGVPSFSSYQFGPAQVAAPTPSAVAPVAPNAAPGTPVVPSSNVAQVLGEQQALQSPVQVGQAAQASPSSPVQQEQQVEQQQQVVEKQAETKTANKQ